jgi:ribosome-associated protein
VAAKRTSQKPRPVSTGRPKLRTSYVGRGTGAGAEKAPAAKKAVAKKAKAKAAPTGRKPVLPQPKREVSAREVREAKESTAAPRLKRPKGAIPLESLASDSSRAMAVEIASAALDKKAVGLEVLDVAGRVDYADFLVLMTGRSDRQVVALAEGIEEALRRKGKRALSVEGLPHANWVVLDFGDVVVHVFQEGARSMYDLDGLWMDARRIPLPAMSD